ncbi:MAG TPA: GNAT family N-acetyltransferase [Methanothrix sp.]|nr:GNAT family N-acetyltransferase [Methanothrix sp.]HPR66994.1 GNAT family N-acetyltransferase [Methanothrix sp.]
MTAKHSTDLSPSILIRTDLHPGDIGMVIHLHGVVYAEEQGWDSTFDAYVAGPIAEFVKSRSDRDRIWIVERAEGAGEDGGRRAARIAGSVAIVKVSETEAQLRWLLLAPEVRGLGLGRRLAEEALAFSRSVGYKAVFLWTVQGLLAATSLYESLGFVETDEKTSEIWGDTVTEVRYELRL